jgi:uncharacterized protein YgbK (DUF1537 family)
LPEEWPIDPLPEIRKAIADGGAKLVVLDDDPTGAQTVHDVPVLTEWSVDILTDELRSDLSNFYLLTNTRSMSPDQARALNTEVARNLVAASEAAGREIAVVGRSDSTLRGHFPAETDALIEGLGTPFDALFFIPFFLEGGRYTIENVHYVAEGDWLTPASETEFAHDASFAFRSSNLRDWVAEKTEGRVPVSSVHTLTLEDLRNGGPDVVAEKISMLRGSAVCIVNAASMRDLEVLVLALLRAERGGKRFIYRTAASFIRARLGQTARPLLTRDEMISESDGGGLVIVGSYVQRTTSQLQHLLASGDVHPIEAQVSRLLSESERAAEIERVAADANRILGSGENAVIFTSRDLVTGSDAEENLSIIRAVSQGMVEIARRITVRPRFLIAKGGNTSSDLATRGLNVKRCTVPGQILPGVPVWELGGESRFPGLKYVVFPGNVGGPDALTSVVKTLTS